MQSETLPIRQGEELDVTTLEKFLRDSLTLGDGKLQIEQFPAGSSNLTYLVSVGDQQYVLRRPPFGNTVKTAHDMGREFRVLSKLAAVYRPAPRPLLFCDDSTVIGSEFYLMERREGLILRGSVLESVPPAVAGGAVDVGQTETLENSNSLRLAVCKSFIANLVKLHNIDYKAAGLGDLGKPCGYARRQVEGWSRRYFEAKTNDLPTVEKTIAWLNDNIPPDSGASLVHNDYKFDNIMLNPDDLTEITAVLDWEMVTVGDPLMDLGTTLGYWMSRDASEDMMNMPFNPRVLMENISRQELVEMYAMTFGREISNILFYYVFGTFKIAVIAQQIYGRYVKGFTRDERFANFNLFAAKLGKLARHAIETKAI